MYPADLFVFCPKCKESHLKPGETHQFNLIIDGPTEEVLNKAFSDWKRGVRSVTFQMDDGEKFEFTAQNVSHSKIHTSGTWVFEGIANFKHTPGSSYHAVILYDVNLLKGEVAH